MLRQFGIGWALPTFFSFSKNQRFIRKRFEIYKNSVALCDFLLYNKFNDYLGDYYELFSYRMAKSNF